MFTMDLAVEWSSAIVVVAAVLVSSAVRTRRTLRERQLESVRWDSGCGNPDDSLNGRANSLYF